MHQLFRCYELWQWQIWHICADNRAASGSRGIVIFVIKIVPSCACRLPNCVSLPWVEIAEKVKLCCHPNIKKGGCLSPHKKTFPNIPFLFLISTVRHLRSGANPLPRASHIFWGAGGESGKDVCWRGSWMLWASAPALRLSFIEHPYV